MAYFVKLLIFALVAFFTWKVIKVLHYYFREYYVLWNIAVGGSNERRKLNPKVRLHVYVCNTNLLDEVSVNELYQFLIKMIDSEIPIKDFHSILLSYKFAIICRERKDGSLRGVMLMGVDRKEHNGQKYTYIRMGLGFFQNYYQGGPLLYYVTAYHILKELILHPFVPVYVIGKAFTFKSYLVLRHNFPESYPRPNAETPEFERGIINDFGRSVKLPNEVYNEETFVLEREKSSVKDGVAILTKEEIETDPNIKFFVERNPHWVKGHQMIALGRATWIDVARMLWRSFKRSVFVGRKRPRKSKPEDDEETRKRYVFINESSRRFSTVCSKIDVGGTREEHILDDPLPEEEDPLPEEDDPVPEVVPELPCEVNKKAGRRLKRTLSRLYSYDIFNDLDL